MKEKYLMLGLDLETLCQDCNVSVCVFFCLVLLVLKRLRCVLQCRDSYFSVRPAAFYIIIRKTLPLLYRVRLQVRLQIRETNLSLKFGLLP